MSGQQQSNTQKKQAAIEKARKAVAEAHDGTQQEKDAAAAELTKAQQMPD